MDEEIASVITSAMFFGVFDILQESLSFFVAFPLLDDNNTQFAKLIDFASDLESSTEKRW